jgi:hypothetical protein
MFRDRLSLQHFAEAPALPGNVMEIADPKIWLHKNKQTKNIWLHDEANDSNDTKYIARGQQCLAGINQLGVICSKQLPGSDYNK